MSRCRLVYAEVLLDERLAGVSPPARLFLLGAAMLADPNGVLENRPLRIKVASMPHDPVMPDVILAELRAAGVILVSADGSLLKIQAFHEWFKPFNNEVGIDTALVEWRGTGVEHGEPSPNLPPTFKEGSDKISNKESLKKEKRIRKPGLFPIDEGTDAVLKEAYANAVDYYPTTDKGHNAKTGSWCERRVQRDCPTAQAAWLAIIRSGKATAEELAACAYVAADGWGKLAGQEFQFIPNFASFFGPEKAPWLAHLPAARRLLREQA